MDKESIECTRRNQNNPPYASLGTKHRRLLKVTAKQNKQIPEKDLTRWTEWYDTTTSHEEEKEKYPVNFRIKQEEGNDRYYIVEVEDQRQGCWGIKWEYKNRGYFPINTFHVGVKGGKTFRLRKKEKNTGVATTEEITPPSPVKAQVHQ